MVIWIGFIIFHVSKKKKIYIYIYCGDRPKIIGWLGPRPVQGHSPSEETSWPKQSLFRPTRAKRTCSRSNFSSDTAKSGSKVRPSLYSPSSKYVKKEGNPKYLSKGCHHHIKCITTTLLATFMKRRPLNSATLATATHKEMIGVSNGTGTQVGVWMINKCKAQMVRKGLYNM